MVKSGKEKAVILQLTIKSIFNSLNFHVKLNSNKTNKPSIET